MLPCHISVAGDPIFVFFAMRKMNTKIDDIKINMSCKFDVSYIIPSFPLGEIHLNDPSQVLYSWFRLI